MLKYPIVVKNSFVPKLCSIFINVYAITIFPWVFIRDEGNDKTLFHEMIHFKQQKELLVVFFYLLYVFDWFHGLWKYRSFQEAYRRIRFEQEAYENDFGPAYVLNRKLFSWRKYKV